MTAAVKILVSACLLGRPVRYDGGHKAMASLLLAGWQAAGLVVPLCPEVAAGLPTPRPPAELAASTDADAILDGQGRVVEASGANVSAAYLAGAHLALDLAQRGGCRFALLTDGSPSCGVVSVYDGTFSGRRIDGQGVTAALLRRHGILVFSHHQIDQLAEQVAAPFS